jgi:hypothetical protein
VKWNFVDDEMKQVLKKDSIMCIIFFSINTKQSLAFHNLGENDRADGIDFFFCRAVRYLLASSRGLHAPWFKRTEAAMAMARWEHLKYKLSFFASI